MLWAVLCNLLPQMFGDVVPCLSFIYQHVPFHFSSCRNLCEMSHPWIIHFPILFRGSENEWV